MSGINDFCFKIGTVNGTGSASANSLLMQAIFRMGIPVVGKNVFPSNIQGLPTWYEIRVSKDGYTARTAPFDLVVAMNTGTYARDVREIASGGYLMYDASWPMARSPRSATASAPLRCRWWWTPASLRVPHGSKAATAQRRRWVPDA